MTTLTNQDKLLPNDGYGDHCGSNETPSLEFVALHFAGHCQLIRRTLRNDVLPPPLRLRQYFLALLSTGDAALYAGCLVGKLSAETQDLSPLMRRHMADMRDQIQQSLSYCMSAAKQDGILPPHSEADELAGFIFSSLQGAMLIARIQLQNAVLLRCQRQLLQMLGW